MLNRYIHQILNIFNYVDSALIVDNKCIIRYYHNLRQDINPMTENEIIGKSIFEVYPGTTEENSTIMEVLHTGQPITNHMEEFTNFRGITIHDVTNTFPIMDKEKVIGAAVISSYQPESIVIPQEQLHKSEGLFHVEDIISASPAMIKLKNQIVKVAQTNSSVLVYGETGTGKEMVAQSIHSASPRKNKSFISQNCAAIPSSLLESLLFGTTKGSFTGAENKPGLFELANGGTLFLDEVNSMEYEVQSKILKAIEEKKITRIGGTTPIPVDIKIISAMNENPLHCMQSKKLRSDLFYRLSVVQLYLPPLRMRMSDLTLLTDYFIDYFNDKMSAHIINVDEEVAAVLRAYHWPGNVRELRSVIESGFNLASGSYITKEDLPQYISNRVRNNAVTLNFSAEDSLQDMVDAFEKDLIISVLANSLTYVEAAKKLKISKQTLHNKLKKHNIISIQNHNTECIID